MFWSKVVVSSIAMPLRRCPHVSLFDLGSYCPMISGNNNPREIVNYLRNNKATNEAAVAVILGGKEYLRLYMQANKNQVISSI